MTEAVTCPCGCNHTFVPDKEVSTPRSRKGAKEALTWTALKRAHIKLLYWGISGLWAFHALSKDEIYRGYGRTTIDAINARISELWALDLVERIIDRAPPNPGDTVHRSNMVRYKLNLERVLKILNNGGRLK